MEKNTFAVDIGGSKLICGVLTETGKIIDTYRVDYPAHYTLEELIQFIKNGYEALKKHSFSYCGVAIPGLCDCKNGNWIYSPFSGIKNVPIGEIVSQITAVPTYCDNDVNVSALAEKFYGVCKDSDDFFWITVSNGIGGGLFLNGNLYRGKNMNSGEIGHLIIEENTSRRCGCGNIGCLESMASGASISAIYKERVGIEITAKDIAIRARNGDDVARDIWNSAGMYIGKAISSAVNLLGLDTFVLGGGAAEAFDLLKSPIDSAIKRYVFLSANPNVKVMHSALGKYAALTGCAALVQNQLNLKGEENE